MSNFVKMILDKMEGNLKSDISKDCGQSHIQTKTGNTFFRHVGVGRPGICAKGFLGVCAYFGL